MKGVLLAGACLNLVGAVSIYLSQFVEYPCVLDRGGPHAVPYITLGTLRPVRSSYSAS